MQKDNKISTLEAKLGGSSPVETKVKQYAALKNPNMRQVQAGSGKITKAVENAEKFVIDTISKRPSATKSQGTPKDPKTQNYPQLNVINQQVNHANGQQFPSLRPQKSLSTDKKPPIKKIPS